MHFASHNSSIITLSEIFALHEIITCNFWFVGLFLCLHCVLRSVLPLWLLKCLEGMNKAVELIDYDKSVGLSCYLFVDDKRI